MIAASCAPEMGPRSHPVGVDIGSGLGTRHWATPKPGPAKRNHYYCCRRPRHHSGSDGCACPPAFTEPPEERTAPRQIGERGLLLLDWTGLVFEAPGRHRDRRIPI